MTETKEMKISEEELKQYLYAELSEEKREELEEKLFLDDEIFFEAASLENELVDQYAKNKLQGAELIRFERSLRKVPERKQKIANAIALQTYLAEERPEILPTESLEQTFWQKLAEFFTIKSPVFNAAMAGLLVFLTIGGVFLFLDNRRKGEELARLQNNDPQNVWKKREDELQNQLTNSNKRLEELNNQLENKSEESDELIKTLGSEQQKIRQLQKDLEKIRQEKDKLPSTPKPSAPEIATVLLSPDDKIGGNDGNQMTTTSVGEKTKKVAVNLTLSNEVKKDEKLSILLNGKPYLQNISPRVSADGKRSISLTIPTQNLPDGENKLTVVNSEGKEITKYVFNVEKSD